MGRLIVVCRGRRHARRVARLRARTWNPSAARSRPCGSSSSPSPSACRPWRRVRPARAAHSRPCPPAPRRDAGRRARPAAPRSRRGPRRPGPHGNRPRRRPPPGSPTMRARTSLSRWPSAAGPASSSSTSGSARISWATSPSGTWRRPRAAPSPARRTASSRARSSWGCSGRSTPMRAAWCGSRPARRWRTASAASTWRSRRRISPSSPCPSIPSSSWAACSTASACSTRSTRTICPRPIAPMSSRASSGAEGLERERRGAHLGGASALLPRGAGGRLRRATTRSRSAAAACARPLRHRAPPHLLRARRRQCHPARQSPPPMARRPRSTATP